MENDIIVCRCRSDNPNYIPKKWELEDNKLMFLLSDANKIDRKTILNYIKENKNIINKNNRARWTPLHYASAYSVVSNLKDLIIPLINAGLDPNALTRCCNSTVLMLACNYADEETVKILLDNGAKVSLFSKYTPLMISISRLNPDPNIIKLLLDYGANINYQTTSKNITSLMLAVRTIEVRQCDHQIIKLLLEYDCNVNLRNKNYRSALMKVCKGLDNEKNCQTIRLLKEYRANSDLQDKNGQTALMIACKKSKYMITNTLLEYQINVDIQDHMGYSALIHVCQNPKCNNVKIVELLLEHHADIDIRDNKGWTPLMHACKREKKEFIDILLRNGANVNITNNLKKTALFLTLEYNQNTEIALKLLDYGAKYIVKDYRNKTFLNCMLYILENEKIKIIMNRIYENYHFKMIIKNFTKEINRLNI